LFAVAAAAVLALAAPEAPAQDWPAKPVKIIVTFAPGGSSDIVARIINGPLQEKLGQPFLDVVSYRFGIADPKQHYHLPFKCTPWGYSCFRGGA
jgi:tripartite-type tricarboxylate transporter receptor subunit TctC